MDYKHYISFIEGFIECSRKRVDGGLLKQSRQRKTTHVYIILKDINKPLLDRQENMVLDVKYPRRLAPTIASV